MPTSTCWDTSFAHASAHALRIPKIISRLDFWPTVPFRWKSCDVHFNRFRWCWGIVWLIFMVFYWFLYLHCYFIDFHVYLLFPWFSVVVNRFSLRFLWLSLVWDVYRCFIGVHWSSLLAHPIYCCFISFIVISLISIASSSIVIGIWLSFTVSSLMFIAVHRFVLLYHWFSIAFSCMFIAISLSVLLLHCCFIISCCYFIEFHCGVLDVLWYFIGTSLIFIVISSMPIAMSLIFYWCFLDCHCSIMDFHFHLIEFHCYVIDVCCSSGLHCYFIDFHC